MKNKKEIGRKSHKSTNSNAEVWTEEQYETYLKGIYGIEFIAGYTENGVPYGIFEDEENTEFFSKVFTEDSDDEELPFGIGIKAFCNIYEGRWFYAMERS